MSPSKVTRIINAPLEIVFKTISEVSEFSKAVPDVVNVEFVSDTRSGVGTVFRETRSIKDKESTVELEVTEYVLNERVRYVADSHGTIWDSVYTVEKEDGATLLTLTMDARAHKLAAKLMNPLVRTMVQKALEADMDSVKAYCEGLAFRNN
jgi:carbon monoxide dehydrogenase subunit G